MIVATLVAAQVAGTLDLSDTTRLDARSSQPAPTVNTSATTQGRDVLSADASTVPSVRLALKSRFWDYTLGYAPMITAPELELGFAPQTLHSANAGIAWHGRFVRVSVTEGLSYGTLNSAFLYAQPTQTVATPAGQTTSTPVTTVPQTVGAPKSIVYGSSSTNGNISFAVGRHSSFIVSGGYSVAGGLNSEAQTILPEQYGPLGALSYATSTSRQDTLAVTALGQYTVTTGQCPPAPVGVATLPSLDPTLTGTTPFCVIDTPTVQLQVLLRHSFTAAESLSLTIGAAGAIAKTPYVDEAVIDPNFLVTYIRNLGARGTSALTASVGVSPTVDLRTGLPSTRALASASLSENIAPRTPLTFTAAFQQSVPIPVPDPYPITSLSGTLDIQKHLNKEFDVGVGLQSLWQNQPGYGNLVSNIGYLSVTARVPTMHF